jgi:hypothetical protein
MSQCDTLAAALLRGVNCAPCVYRNANQTPSKTKLKQNQYLPEPKHDKALRPACKLFSIFLHFSA